MSTRYLSTKMGLLLFIYISYFYLNSDFIFNVNFHLVKIK